ncbi:MAG: ATP-dependent DNA ligase [Armatimonadetes bacterium]|nr:ATP-dependent DNA ligase [Armatimonadota bacterium]
MAKKNELTLEVGGREVRVSNPDKVFFPTKGRTKIDMINYFLHVAEGAVRNVFNRPMVMKRFVDGAEKPPFYQKRAPENRPEWLKTAIITFPSGRFAEEVVVDHPAALVWVVNLGCIDLNPWAVRTSDVDHPDELRVDLDPTPQASWDDVRRVALIAGEVLRDFGLTGFPKTSGSRGIHINARVEPKYTFVQVRRGALALAREIERRAPALATTAWWKEERHGVFVDYNQNARDRTVASAYSIRPTPDARASCPLRWDEVETVDPAAYTIDTMPARYDAVGDLTRGIDEAVGSLDALMALSERQESEGQSDAPWPPNYPKMEGEPPRVQPSRRKKTP